MVNLYNILILKNCHIGRFKRFYSLILILILNLSLCTCKSVQSSGVEFDNVYFAEDGNFHNDIVSIVKREAVINNTSSDSSVATEEIEKPVETETVQFSTTVSSNSAYDSTNMTDLEVDGQNTSIANVDDHIYYQSVTKRGMKEVETLWVEMDELNKVIAHGTLSHAYRRALTVTLSFDFPFYGHILRNVTITTGGFLYTGSFLHKWLAATQYIAPLMANFDTSLSPEATVKYTDNGTSLTVQWEKVKLKDNPDGGSFTFQATIHKTGKIVFAYKDVPVTVKLIKDEDHPVKVGLSDAYIVQKTIFYVRKKTIYEYHKIDMKNESELTIQNWTAIVFDPMPNCVQFTDCDSCLTSKTAFTCAWCPKVQRCSDGLDRYRQDWLDGGCDMKKVSNASTCALLPPPPTTTQRSLDIVNAEQSKAAKTAGLSQAVTGLMVFVMFIVVIAGWLAYAYFFPHSTSGQFLIKYRPSTWSWRRGEARYTAATMHSIHM